MYDFEPATLGGISLSPLDDGGVTSSLQEENEPIEEIVVVGQRVNPVGWSIALLYTQENSALFWGQSDGGIGFSFGADDGQAIATNQRTGETVIVSDTGLNDGESFVLRVDSSGQLTIIDADGVFRAYGP